MNRILLGKGEQPVYLHAQYGNRHGLVAGATGTGKTVSLMVLAEGFSRLGVPVFMADVKGDVAGLAMPGSGGEKIQARVRATGVEGHVPEAQPGGVLGSVREIRSSGSHDHQRARADAARQDSRAQRSAAGCARNRVHAGRRSRPAAARPRRSPRAAHLRRGKSKRHFGEVRSRQRAIGRRYPARPALARARRGRSDVRRARPRVDRSAPHGSQRPRHHQRARRRSAGSQAAPVFKLSVVAPVRVVREPARGRRSRQAEARLHVRRSASAVRRCAGGAARARRTGGADHPVEGGRRLFLLAVPGRCARRKFSGSSAIACSTRCARSRRETRKP